MSKRPSASIEKNLPTPPGRDQWEPTAPPASRIAVLAMATMLTATQGTAAERDPAPSTDPLAPEQVCEEGACTLTYDPAFFSRYAPVTALDMLQNVPGFRVDDGDSGTRGFGGAAGNVVVNGARLSTKSDSTSEVLSRIPASDVLRIDVIRGQVGGLDLRGQNVVANVIRRGGSGSGAWNAGLASYHPAGDLQPFAEASYSASADWGEATLGLFGNRNRFILRGREFVTGPDGALTEDRQERFDRDNEEYGGSFNGTANVGNWELGTNIGASRFEGDGGELSRRFPTASGADPFALFQGDTVRRDSIEVGLDATRPLGEAWQIKLIGLYRDTDSIDGGSLVRGPIGEVGVTETETVSESLEEERIGRLEVDFNGFEGHTLEFSAELSENVLESDFALRSLDGGALVEVPVPGAETRVEETRLDLLLSDSFRIGEVSIDAALGAEDSTVSQEGGFAEERGFFFWKPSLTLSYAPTERTQWRFRALRNVGQLDLDDFVSGADLGDVELALGNPQLSPETTTTVDLSYELRGEGIGIGTVTLFHDWVEDVNDLLPLTGNLEVPGNIGSARRAGVRFSMTLPLDVIGIQGGRLDWRGRWQTSSVEDPLTGQQRALSSERRLGTFWQFRQDLPARKFAWGAQGFWRDGSPQFGLDELDDAGQRVDFDMFVESRYFDGLVITLRAEDVLRDGQDRDRRVFAGDRSTQPLAFREERERSRSTTFSLEVRGNI